MISRLSIFAALFAVVTTTSLAFAANAHEHALTAAAAAKQVPVVQLERVVVIGKRLPQAAI